MRKVTYLAVLEPSADGYGVFFPDLPGCTSFGINIEDAQNKAADALGLHLYGMEKDNEEIPSPSLKLKAEDTEGCIVCLVTIYPDIVKNELDNRAVKTNLTIPAWLKDIAEKEGINYSKIFQSALMDYLGLNKGHSTST